MKKAEAINQFTDGLIMDLYPLTQSNKTLTNALNATIITFDGNEYVLQNDMGNGKVETAYLPEGYVPLGTTSFGGIIYIVSYNPLNNRCQIGSFPSPERNISKDKVIDNIVSISNSDFEFDDTQIPNTQGALVYYLKKNLQEGLTFNPGDKFIVYGDTIGDNYEKFYNQDLYTNTADLSVLKKHTLKLDIGTITENGKLVKFSNLKQYKVTNNGDLYHIFQCDTQLSDTDLDEYRSLVQQPYNIFNSKVSGRLVLIAELIQFNEFSVNINNEFSEQNGIKIYNPSFTFNFNSDYPVIPNSIICKLTLHSDQDVTSEESYIIEDCNLQYPFTEYSISENCSTIGQNTPIRLGNISNSALILKLVNLAENGYFNQSNRSARYYLKYTFTPCMNWGPVSYLAVTGQIDLDKLGSGFINLNQWRYYIEDNRATLTWGLEVYEEPGYYIDRVKFIFRRLIDTNIGEKLEYNINYRTSYFGIFNESIPLNAQSYKILDEQGNLSQLNSNQVYLVEINVVYKNEHTEEVKKFYRWLFTNAIFNEYYVDTEDFKELKPTFIPKADIEENLTFIENDKCTKYGVLTSEEINDENLDSKSSISAVQYDRSYTDKVKIAIGLENEYNTFIWLPGLPLPNITIDDYIINTSASIAYSEIPDYNQDTYLASNSQLINSQAEFDNNKICNDSNILDTQSFIVFPQDSRISYVSGLGTKFIYDIKFNTLQTVKAYCTKKQGIISYNGRFIPLAYNKDTFAKYNFQWSDKQNSWVPSKIGTWGFGNVTGKNNKFYLGLVTPSDYYGNPTAIINAGDEDFTVDWKNRNGLASQESSKGWANTMIITHHKYGSHTYGDGDQGDFFVEAESYMGAQPSFLPLLPYSYPSEDVNHISRLQLAFKGKNTNTFIPINCSVCKYSDDLQSGSTTGDLFENSIFKEFYYKLACFLNSIYRYDSKVIEKTCIYPEYVFWMDKCEYSISTALHIKKKNPQGTILVKLDSGNTVKLNELQTTFNTVFSSAFNDSSLQNNIEKQIADLDKQYQLNMNITDEITGKNLRNYILNLSEENSYNAAVYDYDGSTVIGTSNINGNFNELYMKLDNNDIAYAGIQGFHSKEMIYDNGQCLRSTGENVLDKNYISTSEIIYNIEDFDLNHSFTLNNDGLLVLQNPEYHAEFKGVCSHDNDFRLKGYDKTRIYRQYQVY